MECIKYNLFSMEEQKDSNKKKNKFSKVVTFFYYLIPICGLLAGIYMLVNILSPNIEINYPARQEETLKKTTTIRPELSVNKIIIPQMAVDLPIVIALDNSYKAELIALDKGVLNRVPKNGNPKDGGNYVLAAHRFDIGWTPEITRAKSPFYHIENMKVKDRVYVDYEGIRYVYEIDEIKSVRPNAVEIEARTKDKRLTVYTCDLAGADADRHVFFAKQIGKIAWDDKGEAKVVNVEQ